MRVERRQQPMQRPTGIPGWLQQFLNSQGGMQGLLYSAGGIQGLLQMIQQQSQPRAPRAPNNNPDPLGWQDWLTANHPPPEYPLGKTFQGRLVVGDNSNPQPGDITYATQKRQDDANLSEWYFGAPQQSNVDNWGRTLSLEDIEQFKAAEGLRGDAMLAAIPERFRNTRQALQMAQLGRNPDVPSDTFALDPRIMIPGVSGGASLKPIPLSKYDYAAKYGYAMPNAPEWEGQQYSSTGQLREDQRVNPMARPNNSQILQTLRNAGWDPDTQGWGPQEWEGKTPEQQTMLNDLVYAISPKNAPLGTSRERYLAKQKEAPLPEAPDPFAGLQGAIERDAYVNETLGGGFFGGVIPEEDARNTFGNRRPGGAQDPHFPTPQLALNPLPGQSKYDTYAGWAADQGAAFGEAPWASDSAWGHAQGFDRPNLYQQPPPPTTAWQPTPQFGGWGGTQGWGNTSRNGTNNWGGNTQQQTPSMSFGQSPWGNPWGMR